MMADLKARFPQVSLAEFRHGGVILDKQDSEATRIWS
jgi:hypothetical protein